MDSAEKVMLTMYGERVQNVPGVGPMVFDDPSIPTTHNREYPTTDAAIMDGAVMAILQLISCSRSGALCGVHETTSPTDDCLQTLREYVIPSAFTDYFEKRLQEPVIHVEVDDE